MENPIYCETVFKQQLLFFYFFKFLYKHLTSIFSDNKYWK